MSDRPIVGVTAGTTMDPKKLLPSDEKIKQAVENYLEKNPVALPVVTEEDNGKVLTVADGKWTAKDLPVYDGEYEITPSVSDEQILNTAQTFMDANVKIKKIPFYEVSNNNGGNTVYIGSEV